jgi:hypothetical protein
MMNCKLAASVLRRGHSSPPERTSWPARFRNHPQVLRGNPGRRALNPAEPDSPYLQDLTPPPFLTSERTREVWTYLAPRAAEAKLLCELDVVTFAMHCDVKRGRNTGSRRSV